MEIEAAWGQFDQLKGNIESTTTEYPVSRFSTSNVCECGEYRRFVRAVHQQFVLSGDLPVCTNCGRCDDTYVLDEPEWGGGMDDDGEVSDPSRVGAPTNTDHFSDGWNLGTRMPTNTRLGKINFYVSNNHRDRALYLAYLELDNINKTKLGFPDHVMYAAKTKYKYFVENVLTRGSVRTGIKANCVFQAAKEAGINRTSKEIAAAFGIDSKDISRTTNIYREQVPDMEDVTLTKPKHLIPRFFNDINVENGNRLKMKCIHVCEQLESCVKLQGRTPKAVACAVIFVVLNGAITKKDICKICDVSPPTLAKLETIVKSALTAT